MVAPAFTDAPLAIPFTVMVTAGGGGGGAGGGGAAVIILTVNVACPLYLVLDPIARIRTE